MCAIAGIVGPILDGGERRKILDTMQRRGPDGEGEYVRDNITILHTRLAIIDPIGGAQPMEYFHGDENYVITYNGEIYNTNELRRDLENLGHTFQTHCDTEIVLHAYAQWGADALERINGIFAFAVVEEKRNRIFLARDRIGVKPLFYIHRSELFAFASEIKSLLAVPGVHAQLDADGAAQILLLGPGRAPGSGVFKNIYEIEPGQCGYYENGILTLHRYWKLLDRPHIDPLDETIEKVRMLVMDAITRQTVSDVPIGTFLSGGLDSSIISAVCADIMAQRGHSLDTFSLDYVDNDKYFQPSKFQPNSDTSYIKIMQEYLQCDHHWTVLTPDALLESLRDSVLARDLPGMADVDSALLVFCGKIRPHVKVALSGECADEIFGGYPWYRDPDVRDADGFPWAQTTKQRAALLQTDLLQKIDPTEFVYSHYADTIEQCDILPYNTPLERRMKQMVNLNFRWFMQTLLDRKDRMSMYHGLEVRVPFCDYRIAEYLYTVPWEYKNYMGMEKGLLRRAMEGILPSEVLYRKKSPFPKTHDPRYLTLVSEALRNVIQRTDSPIFALVSKDKLASLLDMDFVWPWYGQLMRRPQTIAYMLQINTWLEEYRVQIV